MSKEEIIASIGVCPGDNLTTLLTTNRDEISMGNGLIVNQQKQIISTYSGSLYSKRPNQFWIEHNKNFYEPIVNDQIIGIVDDRGGDYYKVNIFATNVAILNRLSFDGATKRNKPELKKGDVVYARVQSCHKDLDTEISCATNTGIRKDWSSGESVGVSP